MSTSFLSPDWRMPTNKNQSKQDNYSLDFDGSSQYIAIAPTTATDMTGYNTIALWVKRAVTGVNHYLFTKRGTGPEYAFFIETTNLLGFDDGTGSKAYGNTAIPSNVWTHVAVVVESGGCVFYVNGVADGGAASGISVAASTNTTYIGRKYNGPPQMNGQINEVCFFDYALSPSQVTTLWGGGTSVSNPMALPSSPIAYYPLGTSAWNGNYLAENNAIGDYVFGNLVPNDYISLGNDFVNSTRFTDGFTMDCWVKNWNVTGNAQNVFINQDNGGSGLLSLYSSWSSTSDFRIWLNAGSGYVNATNSSNWSDNTRWVHLCAVWDRSAGTLVLYSNGQAGTVNSSAPTSWGSHGTGIETQVGNTNAAGGLGLEMSNVHFWNGPISASEVETLYNYGSPIRTLANIPQSSNLKAWYKLDASEIYNSSTTEWEVNQAQAPYQNSVFCPNVSGQTVTDYLQVSNYSGTTGKTAASWSFWYNTLEANNQGGWLSGGSAEFKRNNSGQQPGMEFTLYTDVAGVDKTWSTYFTMPYGNWYIQAPESEVLNKWINVVLTYDQSAAPEFGTESGSIILYVNGVKQATSSGTSGGVTNPGYSEFPAEGTIRTGNLIFGGGDFASRHVSASLSNYVTWDKALTQAEINEIVNGGQPKDLSTHSASSDLISWWKLNNLTTGLVDTIGGYNASVVGSNSYTNAGSVSQLNGTSSGMTQANLVQSDLQTVAPYSKYALGFDGIDETILLATSPIVTGVFTISMWIKRTSLTSPESAADQYLIQKDAIGGGRVYSASFNTASGEINFYVWTSNTPRQVTTSTAINDTEWHNVVIVNNGDTINNQVYLDGAEASYTVQNLGVSTLNSLNVQLKLGGSSFYAPANFYGSMSNTSIWNTNLTSSQVTEIYNEGLPSNLNSHSAYSNLVSWWQLGENSSFATNWICADEKGSNNGQSQNMGVDALTNGVGTTANGVSSGMGVEALIGDAPYSTANAISSNMSVLAKGTDPADIPS